MNCLICGSTSKEYSEYSRCSNASCGALRTIYSYDPLLYKAGYALNYVGYADTPVNLPLCLCRLGIVARWLKPSDVIMDFGCCIGEFLRFAEKHFYCVGFEPNKYAATLARHRVNSKVSTSLEEALSRSQDVKAITMFDVLEHVEDPRGLLKSLSKILHPEGVFVVTTPNLNAIPQWVELKEGSWKHYKPKEHLWLHTPESLVTLFEGLGFDAVHIGFEESDIRPGNPRDDIVTFVARRKNGAA